MLPRQQVRAGSSEAAARAVGARAHGVLSQDRTRFRGRRHWGHGSRSQRCTEEPGSWSTAGLLLLTLMLRKRSCGILALARCLLLGLLTALQTSSEPSVPQFTFVLNPQFLGALPDWCPLTALVASPHLFTAPGVPAALFPWLRVCTFVLSSSLLSLLSFTHRRHLNSIFLFPGATYPFGRDCPITSTPEGGV